MLRTRRFRRELPEPRVSTRPDSILILRTGNGNGMRSIAAAALVDMPAPGAIQREMRATGENHVEESDEQH